MLGKRCKDRFVLGSKFVLMQQYLVKESLLIHLNDFFCLIFNFQFSCSFAEVVFIFKGFAQAD